MLCRRIGGVLRVSYTGDYQFRASLWCPHDIYTRSAYCNLLSFLGTPSLILILSIRPALFSGSKAGKGSRNKVQFDDMLCNCLYVFYVSNDQDQFLLPPNGFSDLILDCVAIWPFLVMNLSEYCTMHDWNRIALLHPNFVNQWRRLFFRTILQFSYNFSLVVANSVCLFVLSCFVFFSLCSLVNNRFY